MKRVLPVCLVLLAAVLSAEPVHSQLDGDAITVGHHRIIHSDIMNEERMLYVHLPEDYETAGDAYPVVFQLYGHFTTSYFLPAVRTVDQMGRHGLAPKMIVVGVKNNEFRYRDLLPVDHFGTHSQIDRFLRFFEQELIPWVEDNYRARPFRILAGPQAGAAFGIYAFANRPGLFNAYLLTNPFWIESSREMLLALTTEALSYHDYSRIFMMINLEEEESEAAVQALVSFGEILAEAEKSPRYLLHHHDPQIGFSTPLDFEIGIKALFSDYQFPDGDDPSSLDTILEYYDNLSQTYGYALRIPEFALVFQGDKFMEIDNHGAALEIYTKMYQLYPGSLMAMDRMGWVHKEIGDQEKARRFYAEFLEVQPGNPRVLGILDQLRSGPKK